MVSLDMAPQAEDLPNVACLKKPFRPSELIAALRSRAERDAVAIETLVERALKEWLQKHRS